MSGVRSLRQRLLRQFLSLSLLPVAGLSVLSALLLAPALIAHGEERNRELAVALREQVELQLVIRRRMAQQLAAELAAGSLGKGELQPALQAMVDADRFLQAAYVADERGIVTDLALPAGSGQHVTDLIGVDESKQPHFQRARQSRMPTWSETFLSTMTGQVSAVLVVAAGPQSVIVEFSLAGLSESLAALGQARSTRCLVLDAAGRVIGHPDPGQALRQENLRDLPLVATALGGRAESGRIRLEREDHIAHAMPVPSVGWTVLVAQPLSAVLAPLLRLGWLLTSVIVLTLVAAAGGAWVLSRRTGAEVQRLAEAAQYAAGGDRLPPEVTFETTEFADVWHRLRMLFEELHERDAQTESARRDLQAVLDAATQVAIIATDTDGLVTVFSAGARKMLQRHPDEVIGTDAWGRWHDPKEVADRGDELSRQLGRPIEGFEVFVAQARHGGYEVRDWTFLRPEGPPILVSLAVTAMRRPDGSLKGFLAVAIDITHRRRAESLELAQRSAEAASQAKSDFLSRMSHELRSPLNAMLGYAQLLEMDENDKPSEGQRVRVQQIQRAGWHLVQLIDDVLDLSRIESGQMRVSIEPVDVAMVIERAAEMTAGLMSAHGVQFRRRWVGEDGAASTRPVIADATRLTQVLVNLLGNAAKYNRPGGSVTLECETLPDRRLAMRVVDSGRGMSAEQLGQLFQPFNRLGLERSEIAGTGIGLVVTQRLVTLMNGSLEVDSVVGEGSIFTVTLATGEPLERPGGDADAASPASRGTRGKVLYIEDNEVNAMLMREVLRQRPNVQLLQASTVAAGLELARQHRPQLVLLDMHLPDAHGSAVLDVMQADPALRDTPVIVVSADATQQQIGAMRRRGVRGYLTKPINVPETLAGIDAVLGDKTIA